MNKLIYFLAVIAFAASLSSCDGHATTESPDKKKVCISDSMTRMVTIDTVKEKSIDEELKLSGEVSFNENKVVKVFPVSSGQVLSAQVSLGDYVHAGQTLAVIKSAEVASNYADLSTAGTDISIAKH